MNCSIPPILLLVFNRPDTTARVFEAIGEVRPARLYVAADGPRPGRKREVEQCEQVRRIATSVYWPCDVRTLFRERNLGCRQAVSSAIDWFFGQEPEGIILEDDCLPSKDFFGFCAELLERFRDDTRVMAVCGSCYSDFKPDYAASYYFSYFADIWGWATWRRAWTYYDRDMARWPEFKLRGGLDSLAGGRRWHSTYWTDAFDATHQRHIGTWDFQWIYTVMEQNGLACYPTRNLVSNIGFRSDATHTVIESDPAANLPREKMQFPLVHPTHVARYGPLERQIEVRRLRLDRKILLKESLKREMKNVVRRLLGDVALGAIDYFRRREQRAAWGGPFNGQSVRRELFASLITELRPSAIIETGTHLGTTTEFMAKTGLPIYTIEANPRNYGFAKVRLWKLRQVTLRQGDCRNILKEFLDGPLGTPNRGSVFAYLDAHWDDDLPLAEELCLLFSRVEKAVVMIDDFEVPGDPGYGYDDYGPGKSLTRAYIDPIVSAHQLQVFYPVTPSEEEDGMRRGCVVLCRDSTHSDALSSCSLLRRA